MIVTPILSRYLSHFSILDRSKFLKIILEENVHHFLPTSSQIPPSFTRITKFPLPSNIEERHSRIAQRKAVFERLEIKETIYFDTAMIDPHHTCHTAPPPQRYAETMDRCARAKEIRVHHRLRNDFGTGRVSFHHVPTFPKQREATITRVRTFLFCLKEGRNIFFFPFFLSFFFFPWIHSNEPRAQLKRYTWTVGKIF